MIRRKSFIALIFALLSIMIVYCTKSYAFIIVSILLVLSLFFAPKNHKAYILLFAIISLFSGIVSYTMLCSKSKIEVGDEKYTVTLKVIEKVKVGSFSNIFYGYMEKINGNKIFPEKVKIKISSDSSLKCQSGDVVEIQCNAKALTPKKTVGGYDENLTERIKGVKVILTASYSDFCVKESSHLPFYFDYLINFKTQLKEKIETSIPYDYANVLCGIVFGSDVENDEIKDVFSLGGISHLLCVSGLHVGYMYILISWVLSLFLADDKKKLKFYIIAFSLLLYCGFVGFGAGVVRSTIMILFVLSAKCFEKLKTDGFNSLCMAALVILLLNPLMLFNISFLLSFSCMVGLVMIYPVMEKFVIARMKSSFLRYILLLLCYTTSVLIMSSPISIGVFHSFTFASLISSVFILPISSVVFALGILYCFLVWLVPMGAISKLITVLINYILVYSKYVASLGLEFNYVRGMFLFEYIFYYIFVFFLFGYLDIKKKSSVILISLASMFLIVSEIIIYMPKNETRVAFLDVGHGDAIVITTPNNKHYLIDGGGNHSGGEYEAERIILPYMYSLGYNTFDGIFITNSSSTQAEAAKVLIKKSKTKCVYFNCVEREALREIETLAGENISVTTLSSGEDVALGENAVLEVLYPYTTTKFISKNASSLVLRLSFEETSILLPSNIPKDVWLDNLGVFSYEKTDIMKASYYGNYYSKIDKIYDIMNPQTVIVSCGNNIFGLPKKALLDMLDKKGIDYYTTRDNGTIEVVVEQKGYKVVAYLQ